MLYVRNLCCVLLNKEEKKVRKFCMNKYSQRDRSVNKEDQEKELLACWGLYSAADDHKFFKIIQV